MLTVQVPPDPKLDEDANVDVLAEKPGAGVQAPLAVVQAAKLTDFMVVAWATVNVNAYVVLALATELPITTLRVVIPAAEATFGKYANSKTAAKSP